MSNGDELFFSRMHVVGNKLSQVIAGVVCVTLSTSPILGAPNIEGGVDYYTQFELDVIHEIDRMKRDRLKYAEELENDNRGVSPKLTASALRRLRNHEEVNHERSLDTVLALTNRIHIKYAGKGTWQLEGGVGTSCTGGIWYYVMPIRGRGEPIEFFQKAILSSVELMATILNNNFMGLQCAINKKGERFCIGIFTREPPRRDYYDVPDKPIDKEKFQWIKDSIPARNIPL